MKKLFLLVIVILLSHNVQAQKQGIRGKITWSSGNQMPGPDKKSSTTKGIKRKIFIYEVATLEQVVQEEGFYKNINTKLVKEAKSCRNGRFRIKLPVGTYSVFVQESKGLWANLFDGKGQINAVQINNSTWTELNMNVNYMAAY
ncbi:hypothetical protein SanaruYs_32850 [Chryseotalea sanaruensis]|uniref:Carboxypeptidase regulatory-like domain-containing protein n=1 Tax=Chryseotalea sanaruensis TaxID=2482724 RepID=A0A401UDV4_9BACT|nr:carboxypeptidase regulatory-like domain-containing protein [Chryseotalea sanaruensis]GCC53044.1 hypothetical protein SanaruYs_32850 [Chryseotalea sanaruensis]